MNGPAFGFGQSLAFACDLIDAKVDEMVQGLLAKDAYTLAWTKRLCNRHVVEQLNRFLDAGIGYEMVGFLQREALGGEDPQSL